MDMDKHGTYAMRYLQIEVFAREIIPKLLEDALKGLPTGTIVGQPPSMNSLNAAADLGVLLAARASTAIDREALKRSIADSEGNGK